MIAEGNFILVQSTMNPWMDYTYNIFDRNRLSEARRVISTAFDEWFDADTCDPIADYICDKLHEKDIEHTLYVAQVDDEW